MLTTKQIKGSKTCILPMSGNPIIDNYYLFYLPGSYLARLPLTDEQIDKLAHLLDWSILSKKELSIKIVSKYYSLIDWPVFICNGKYKSTEMMELIYDELYSNAELFCDPQVKKHYYNKYFIRRFKALVDWTWCLIKFQLPEDIILTYWNIWDKYQLCKYQRLSYNILGLFKDQLRWDLISRNTLDAQILDNFKSYIVWDIAVIYQRLNMKQINRFIHYIKAYPECKQLLPRHQYLDEQFIIKHINWLSSAILYKYQFFSVDFIIKHHKYFDLSLLMSNNYINADGRPQLFLAAFKRDKKHVYYLIDKSRSYELVI